MCVQIENILEDFLEFVGNSTVVGHSVHFDVGMVQAEARRAGLPCSLGLGRHIDTSRLARHYGGSSNYSLTGLMRHYNRSVSDSGEGSHRAMADVRTNVHVFVCLCEGHETVGELFDILSRPVRLKTIPFGKHKGKLMSDIPSQYLAWLVNNFDGFDEVGNPPHTTLS